MRRHWPSLLAEALGAGVLVFAGCGAIVVEELSGGRVTPVGVAMSFGLAIALMIAAVGRISGAHFNPAVTLARLAVGPIASQPPFPAGLVLPYWAAQLAGAFAGAAGLRALFGPAAGLGRTAPAGPAFQAFALEVVLTAVLVFVIAAVAFEPAAPAQVAPWAIGGAITLAALLGGPISGASLNPARSLAPAVLSGSLEGVWIYLTAPLLGGLLGGGVYRLLGAAAAEIQR